MPPGRHGQAPEPLIVAALVVECQRKPQENRGKRPKSDETHGPADSDDSRLGVDDPGCNSEVPGDLRELQLSDPRGLESSNSQIPWDSQVPEVLRVATGSPRSGPRGRDSSRPGRRNPTQIMENKETRARSRSPGRWVRGGSIDRAKEARKTSPGSLAWELEPPSPSTARPTPPPLEPPGAGFRPALGHEATVS